MLNSYLSNDGAHVWLHSWLLSVFFYHLNFVYISNILIEKDMPLILWKYNKYVQVASCTLHNVAKMPGTILTIIPNILSFSQVQKIPNFTYQIFQTLQIYWVYEKDYIKYKYDRKWKTENMAEKHNFQE